MHNFLVNILTNVIAPSHTGRMVGILKTIHFAVLADECTDISGQSYSCIVVRFMDQKTQLIHDSLSELVRIYDTDENANPNGRTLATKILQPFKEADILFTKILASCSDNAKVMISDKSDGTSVS